MRTISLQRRLVAAALGLAAVAGLFWGALRLERPVSLEGGPLVKGAWGTGEGQFGRGAARDGLTYGPRSFAVDGDGLIYVLDWANQRLQRFDARGRLKDLVPLVGANAASLQGATDIAVDPQGGMWLTDNLRGRLAYFQPDGKIQELRLFGDIQGALLEQAGQVAATSGGVVWSQSTITTEEALYRIRRVSRYGEQAAEVFRASLSREGRNGPLPSALAAAGDHFYLLLPVPGEPGAALIQRFGLDGAQAASWKAPGWPDSEMNRPAELLGVDGKGRVYVGTWVKGALHLRIFDPTGVLLAHTQIVALRDVSSNVFARVDGAGNLYIAGLGADGYQISRYQTREGWRLRPRWAQ